MKESKLDKEKRDRKGLMDKRKWNDLKTVGPIHSKSRYTVNK